MPSAWVPQPAPCNELDNYLEVTKELIAAIPIKNSLQNLTFCERKTLQSLKNDTNIVIKPFNKGRGIAYILDKPD